MKSTKQRLRQIANQHRQLLLYGIIGFSGATLDFALYIVFYKFLSISPSIASFLSVSAGILNNFIWNSRHNFKVTDKLFSRFINFYLIGFAGAIMSSLLIVVLFNGLGVNAALAKVITIPPVVLLQFFLNRRYSFSDTEKSHLATTHLALFVRRNRPMIAANLLFLVICLSFVHFMPTTGKYSGADEQSHYGYNVRYILDHHSLPVSGRDDVSAYKNCRDNLYGKVTCAYSYEVYPAANYVVAAFFAWLAHVILHMSYQTGARLASVFFGFVFLNTVFLAARRLTGNPRVSTMIACSVAFIPQVIFISSYVNQDAHSLAISSLLAYTMIRLLQERSMRSVIWFSIVFGGLLPLAKYNYFVFVPVVLLGLFFAWRHKLLAGKLVLQSLLFSLGAFIVLGAFWYIRNLSLYHDALGQSFMLKEMAHYHNPGVAHPLLSVKTFRLYFSNLGFLDTLFLSFFAAYGYFTGLFDTAIYANLKLLVLAAAIVALFITYQQRLPALRRRATNALISFSALAVVSILLVYYNSAVYDFQAQGRYLFPVLAAFAVLLAYLYMLARSYKFLVLVVFLTTAYAFTMGLELFIQVYLRLPT